MRGDSSLSVVRKVEAVRMLCRLSPQRQAEFLESFWRNLDLNEKAAIYAYYVADASPEAWATEQELLLGVLVQKE